MTIKAIVELKVKPGKYTEFMKALEEVHSNRGNTPGFVGVNRYELLDDPYTLIEIVEWESREARQAWIEKIAETGELSRLAATLRESFKAVTVKQII